MRGTCSTCVHYATRSSGGGWSHWYVCGLHIGNPLMAPSDTCGQHAPRMTCSECTHYRVMSTDEGRWRQSAVCRVPSFDKLHSCWPWTKPSDSCGHFEPRVSPRCGGDE